MPPVHPVCAAASDRGRRGRRRHPRPTSSAGTTTVRTRPPPHLKRARHQGDCADRNLRHRYVMSRVGLHHADAIMVGESSTRSNGRGDLARIDLALRDARASNTCTGAASGRHGGQALAVHAVQRAQSTSSSWPRVGVISTSAAPLGSDRDSARAPASRTCAVPSSRPGPRPQR